MIGLPAIIAAFGAALYSFLRRGRLTNIMSHKDPQKSAVMITGGARGIGRDTADYLIARGYSVVVTVRNQSQCDNMKAEAEESNYKTPFPILFDVTKEEHVSTAMEQLKSFLEKQDKDLIAIVNNAGINPEGDKLYEV